MQNDIAFIKESSARLEELRLSLMGLDKKNLLEKKEQIKQLAREHRDTLSNEQLDNNIAEVEALNSQIAEVEEREKTINKEIAELKGKIKDAQERAKQEEMKKEKRNYMENQNIEKVDVRTAFAKHILFESTHGQRKDAALTDMEKRALGIAFTTTSDTFSAPTEEADGINNGGVFIPQSVVLEILREEELESPIYRDVVTTAVKGLVKFPYRISKTGAKAKAELQPTENESVQWGILSGATGNYTDSIVVTFEQEAMAIEEFTDYLISIIGESMRELLIQDYIYGTGTNDHMKGITNGAIAATYTTANAANYRENIEAGIKLLPVKKRAGAKIYLAADIFDGITFEKNENGDYILPVLNGGGLNRMSTFTVEMDANLNAGDFVIGNIGKWYKANINKSMELGLDVSNKNRTKTYTTHMMVTAAPVPNSFVYGKKGS